MSREVLISSVNIRLILQKLLEEQSNVNPPGRQVTVNQFTCNLDKEVVSVSFDQVYFIARIEPRFLRK